MALVNVTNVIVLDNPTQFINPLQFEITFECMQELQDDLEWKVVYVGSAESQEYDQVLEEVMVGPVPVGINRFVLTTSSGPNHQLIPHDDILGVTVILLSCSYLDQKFLQIGYYVNNEYREQYDPENPPNPIDINLVFRSVLADQPRVTRFPINWTGEITYESLPEGDVEIQDGIDVNMEDINHDNETMFGNRELVLPNEDSMDVEQMRHDSGVIA